MALSTISAWHHFHRNLLDHAVARFVGRCTTVRSFTLALIAVTGALSAIVTKRFKPSTVPSTVWTPR